MTLPKSQLSQPSNGKEWGDKENLHWPNWCQPSSRDSLNVSSFPTVMNVLSVFKRLGFPTSLMNTYLSVHSVG